MSKRMGNVGFEKSMITINSTDIERAEILSGKELLVVPWNRRMEFHIDNPYESMSQALARCMDENGVRGKEIILPEFEGSVRFSRTTLNESIRQMTKRHANLLYLGRLLSVVKDVCANAIKIEVEGYRHSYQMTRNEVKWVHQYVSAFHDMTSIYPVKITLYETHGKQRNRFYMVITVGEIEINDKIKEAITNTGMHSDMSEESLSAGDASFSIKITDFIGNFNRDEGIIIKNLPDAMLTAEQRLIKRRVLENDERKEAEIRLRDKEASE